jgi:hypothetical protein
VFITLLLLALSYWILLLPIAITFGWNVGTPQQATSVTIAILSTLSLAFGIRTIEKKYNIDSRDFYEEDTREHEEQG